MSKKKKKSPERIAKRVLKKLKLPDQDQQLDPDEFYCVFLHNLKLALGIDRAINPLNMDINKSVKLEGIEEGENEHVLSFKVEPLSPKPAYYDLLDDEPKPGEKVDALETQLQEFDLVMIQKVSAAIFSAINYDSFNLDELTINETEWIYKHMIKGSQFDKWEHTISAVPGSDDENSDLFNYSLSAGSISALFKSTLSHHWIQFVANFKKDKNDKI